MPKTQTLAAGPQLLNRELSWLDYDERVLELADDESVPLLERVKFCAIFSSMLDEFFMVRVAGLLDQAESGLSVRSADGMTPREALAAIRPRVEELVMNQSRLWRKRLVPALAAEGITVAHVDDCNDDELDELKKRFEREIFPVLTPLAVSPGQPFPFISPLSLSLGVLVRDPDSAEERFARVKVPEGLPRFLELGPRRLLLPLEDVIAHFLDELFPGMEILEQAAFRVTRDADLELSDDADDLLEAVRAEVSRRRFGDVVRVEVASTMSKKMIDRLRVGLGVPEAETYAVQGMLDLSEVMEIAALDRPELKDDPWMPITQARLKQPQSDGDLFSEIRRSDILVHHPYESFTTSYEAFIRTAASDPAVTALKTTVYRTSDESPIVPSLITAAEAGKQTVCLVELKARGDEQKNIEWARRLEQAGVHVVYGFPDLKIHAKTTLVVRREGGRQRRYVHIGTGNYHAVTARSYEDLSLFTADERITADVADLFNFVTGFGRPTKFRKLLVAPLTLKPRLIELIRSVAGAAQAGKRARHRAQGERAHRPDDHPGALPRLGGRRLDRRDLARDLHAAPGRPRPEREHPRPQRPRPLPRAQPPVRVPRRPHVELLHRQRRPDAPKPRPPDRDHRPRRGQARAGRAERDSRDASQRHRAGVGAAQRRHLAPARAGEGRARAGRADRADAPGTAPRAPSGRLQES